MRRAAFCSVVFLLVTGISSAQNASKAAGAFNSDLPCPPPAPAK